MSFAFESALELFPALDPSGNSDSTVALQDVLDLAATGVAIYLPRGSYRVAATLTATLLPSTAFVLVSDFAELRATVKMPTLIRVVGAGSSAGFELRRLLLNSNKMANIGLEFVSALNSPLDLVEQVEATGCLGTGVVLTDCGPGVLRSVASSVSERGWQLTNCRRTVLADCAARYITTDSGVSIRSTATNPVAGPVVTGFHGEFIGYIDKKVTDAAAVCVRLDGDASSGGLLTGVTVADLWTESLGWRAVYATSSVRGVVIDAPRIGNSNVAEAAIFLDIGATGVVTNAVISNATAGSLWGSVNAGPGVTVTGTMLIGAGA